MAYSLRQQEKKVYRTDTKLPPARKTTATDKLYPVEVLEKNEERGQVKVHYVGYGSEFDEWKEENEIVLPSIPGMYNYYHNNYQLYPMCHVIPQIGLFRSTYTLSWHTRLREQFLQHQGWDQM